MGGNDGRLSVLSASSCSACDGCKHQDIEEDGWCYMFRDRPDELPCGQHDKFDGQRRSMGKLILKYPQLLTILVMGMDDC